MDPRDAGELEAMRRQLRLFADDLRTVAERERGQRRATEEAYRELASMFVGMVRLLAHVTELKDPTTRDHLDRGYHWALMLTQRVAPAYAEIPVVGYGYLLHDVGKLLIDDRILKKPGPLTDDEFAVMKTHTVLGVQLLEPLELLDDAIGIVRSHHERWDGRGYPDGLAGESIYLPARIFSIADAFDAMTSKRPYKDAWSIEHALQELEDNAGSQFDPELVAAFTDLIGSLQAAGRLTAGPDDVTLLQ